jgi:hypothetical protein
VPGRLPDPAPGAGDRIRRLQTEPLPGRVRGPADDDLAPPSDSDVATGTHAAAPAGSHAAAPAEATGDRAADADGVSGPHRPAPGRP